MKRVAITGLGVVSAAGRDLGSFWKALTAPAPVFHPVERFSTEGYRTRVGGEIPGGEGDCFAYALAAADGA
jgi:3-oxoacyl-[acyl-carrier-protein] synthase II